VYLTDIGDTSGFLQVWSRHFGKDLPATTLIPTATPGLNTAGASIEINLLALRTGGSTRKESIAVENPSGFGVLPAAARAGDLLLLSGLMAVDDNGLIADAEADPRQPYFGSGIQAQMRHILAQADRICRATGASLENLVRIQQLHTDLCEFYPAYQVWQERLPGRPLPLSAVEVPGPLPVPGCTVLLDLWVYAGDGAARR
jgi:enamine deaminase RidA (YjgF/YER057c/UK114 family)